MNARTIQHRPAGRNKAILALPVLFSMALGLSLGGAETSAISAAMTNQRAPLDEEAAVEGRRGAYREVTNANDTLTKRRRDEVGLETVVTTVDRQGGSNLLGRGRSVLLSNLLSPVGADALSRRPDETVARRLQAARESGGSERGLRLSAGSGANLEAGVNLVRVQGPLSVGWDLLLQNRESDVSNNAAVSNSDLTRFDLGLELGIMPQAWDLGFRADYGVRREGLRSILGTNGEKNRASELRLSPRMTWRGGHLAWALRNDTEFARSTAAEVLAACELVRSATRLEFRASPSEVNFGGGELRYEYAKTTNSGILAGLLDPAFERHRLRLLGGWNFELGRDWFFETALGAALRWQDGLAAQVAPLPYFRATWKRFPIFRASVGVESYEELACDGETFLQEGLVSPSYPAALNQGVRFWMEGRVEVGEAFHAELRAWGDRAFDWVGWQRSTLGLRALRSQGSTWFSGIRASAQVKAGEIFSARAALEGLFPTGTNAFRPAFDMSLSLGARVPDTGTGFRFGYRLTALEMGREADGSYFAIPDRNNLEFAFEQEIDKTVTLGAGVRNLLDADLRAFPGASASGRTFYASLKMEF